MGVERAVPAGRRPPDLVPRKWLAGEIEDALAETESRSVAGESARIVLLIGQPGSGKTVLAEQLTAAWSCANYLIRPGVAADPKNFCIALGLQLRGLYGAEIFGPPALEVHTRLHLDCVRPHARPTAVVIDKVGVSPFQRLLIDVDVTAEDLDGDLLAVRIGEVRQVITEMTPEQLAQEALIDPLRRLYLLHPEIRVRIIVDALDESEEITRLIPAARDLPANVTWLLTSKPGDHLARFGALDQDGVAVIDLAAPARAGRLVEDALTYVRGRLSAVWVAIESGSARSLEEFSRDLAVASSGNFLYLYHLTDAILSDLSHGRSDVLSKTPDELPVGLDGIYRYFIVDRIRAGAGLRDWAEIYAPVLGILAVARAPLTSTQIARYAGVDRLAADVVIGGIWSFLEPVPVPGDLAYILFHQSFADFLLTQDHARNPYPLHPATDYHWMIGRVYVEDGEADWDRIADRYALVHLASHLRDAGRLDALFALLTGRFARQQAAVVGLAQTWSDQRMAARAAALADHDEQLLQLTDARHSTEVALAEEWEAGGYVLSLLETDPQEILDLAGHGVAGYAIPWSSFLAAERLLDIGAVTQARTLLDEVSRRPWPDRYTRPLRGVGLKEGASFDFPPGDDTIEFLALVSLVDPRIALRLARRLFDEGSELPNARTAWRDMLRTLLYPGPGRTFPALTPVLCRDLADVTADWLSRPGSAVGVAGICAALFTLLVRALPAAPSATILWAAQIAAIRRLHAVGTVQGDDGGRMGAWAAVADVATAVTAILRALPAEDAPASEWDEPFAATGQDAPAASHLIGDGNGADVLTPRAALRRLRDRAVADCPQAEPPRAGGYTRRAGFLGHLAFAAHEAGSPRRREFADAALAACAVDGEIDDPPMSAVTEGLGWLHRMPDPNIADAAGRLTTRFGIAAANAVRMTEDGVAARVRDDPEPIVERVAASRDPYRRGRLVLAAWNARQADLAQLGLRLQQGYERGPTRRQPGTGRSADSLAEILAEALIALLAGCAAPWAPEAIGRLDRWRSPGRRKRRTVDYPALGPVRWRALMKAGRLADLRDQVYGAYATAAEQGDIEAQLDCCLAACEFDPDLAATWYAGFERQLEPADQGLAVTRLVKRLAAARPERIDDIGRSWASRLPALESSIAEYEVLLAVWWAPLGRFIDEVRLHLRHIADALPRQIAAELAAALDSQTDAVGRLTSVWKWLGGLLSRVGQIDAGSDSGVLAALEDLVSGVIGSMAVRYADQDPAARRRAVLDVLDGVMADELRGPLVGGPVVAKLMQMVETIGDDGEHRDPAGPAASDFAEDPSRHVILGLELGTRLKAVAPSWSEERFAAGAAFWKSLLDRDREPASVLDHAMTGLIDVLIRVADSGFSSRREEQLFTLTERLVGWCLAEPVSPGALQDLQARLGQVNDVDLRSMLRGPLAVGWLRLNNLQRAEEMCHFAGARPLGTARFYRALKQMTVRRADSASDQQSWKSLVAEVILMTPFDPSVSSMEASLGAWLTLRAGENAPVEGDGHDDAYLRRMAEFTVSLPSPG